MKIIGTGTETFLLLNGLVVHDKVRLSPHIELQPADTSHLDLKTALATCSHPDDIAVVAAFIPRISAQLEITADSSKQLATVAWNSLWDAILLSAVFHREIGAHLQSDTSANEINENSQLIATNHRMHGFDNVSPYILVSDDCGWIASNFDKARQMLNVEKFNIAVHALASHRWHVTPRIQLAVIWAGIEGLFGASTEIRFRISLYIARFLYPDDTEKRKETFDTVMRLYNVRSSAVHGGKLKGDVRTFVNESADILHKLVLKCIEERSTPIEKELVP